MFETLYEGTRGPGKSDALLIDFAQHVGRGYGPEWRGIIFRKTYPELQDIVEKAKKWFPRMWPDSGMHETKHQWEWGTGERLLFRHADKESDYWKYHGHSFPFIAWEELTTWHNLALFTSMMSICRSTVRGIPRKYRATTNPYGVGHNVVKMRYQLPLPKGHIIGPILKDDMGQERVAIRGNIYENKVLLHADPEYIARISAAAPNPAALLAWLEGDWTVVAGGMLDDVWVPSIHVLPDVKAEDIPKGWKIDRSYDHGQSRPFSVGWWAESDGTPMTLERRVHTAAGIHVEEVTVGQVAGDVVRIHEWYGWSGKPNEGVNLDAFADIAPGIVRRERDWGIHERVRPGPADLSIFDHYAPGKSVAGDMKKAPHRVRWLRSDKGPGSRKQGWQQIRKLLKAAIPAQKLDPATNLPLVGFTPPPRKDPALFVCQRCDQFIRTMPALPRDGKDPDDVDTKSEDHIGDEVRYRVRRRGNEFRQEDF